MFGLKKRPINTPEQLERDFAEAKARLTETAAPPEIFGQPNRPIAWIEPDGGIVILDRVLTELGITAPPPERPGFVIDRDASIRAWRYIPTSLSEERALNIARRMFFPEKGEV